MLSPEFASHFLESIIYTLLGVVVFGISFWCMGKFAPFSIRKEIEDDQNTALGIIMGAVLIGLSIIISAAISS